MAFQQRDPLTFQQEAQGNDWMSFINGNKSIADLSIPGTHDSGAIWGEFDNRNLKSWIKRLLHNPLTPVLKLSGLGDTIDDQLDKIPPHLNVGKDQDKTIREQLDMGVRFLDIRLRSVNDGLYVYHGPLPQGQTAESVFDTVREWLEENPSETVLIHLQQNADLAFGESIIEFINGINNTTMNLLGMPTFGLFPTLSVLKQPETIKLNTTYSANPAIIGPIMKFETPYLDNGLQTIKLVDTEEENDKGEVVKSKHVILNGNIGDYKESLNNFINGYISTYKDLIYTDSHIPLLDKVRGKIVLLDYNDMITDKGISIPNTNSTGSYENSIAIEGTASTNEHWGMKYYSLYVQNKYNILPEDLIDDNGKIITNAKDHKFDLFKKHYEDVRDGKAPNSLSYNFLSAFNSQYELTEEEVEWIDDNLNEFTTDFGPNFYSDELNPRLLELLEGDEDVSQLGNIIVDFVTPELAEAIYKTNDPDFYPQTSPSLFDNSFEQVVSLRQVGDSEEITVLIDSIPGLADSGYFTSAIENVYNGSFPDERDIEDLQFSIWADEPVDWEIFGPSFSLLSQDSSSWNNHSVLNIDFNTLIIGSDDDYSSDLNTSGFLEIDHENPVFVSGWLNAKHDLDGDIEFTVRATDRYKNVSDAKIIIERSASPSPISDSSLSDDVVDDTDWFKIYLEKGEVIELGVEPSMCFLGHGTCSTIPDSPVIEGLYSSNGTKVDELQLYDQNTIARITPPEDGFFFVSVGKNDPRSEIGYHLSVETVEDNSDPVISENLSDLSRLDDYSSDDKTSGHLNASNNYFAYGQIDFPGDSDWFKVSLPEEKKVNIFVHDLLGGFHSQLGVNAIYNEKGETYQVYEKPVNSIEIISSGDSAYFVEIFSEDPITSAYSISADFPESDLLVEEVTIVDSYSGVEDYPDQPQDDVYLLITKPSRFKKKTAARFKNFSENNVLLLEGWSHLDQSDMSFRSVKGKKRLKRVVNNMDVDFVYQANKGRLFYNENGDDPGFGDGGLVAILKGSPSVTKDSLFVF